MTRHAIHRVRSARKGLLSKLSEDEPAIPERAAVARALVERVILEPANPALVAGVESFLKSHLPAGWRPEGDHVFLPLLDTGGLPEIPPTHCWKGGAARHLLRRALRVPELPYPVRDLDIARVGRGWTGTDTELSKLHMAEDFAHGHGVEVIADRGRYFSSRDLSINELLAGPAGIDCSVVALLDTLGQVLRPCRYFSGTLHQPSELPSRGSAKMVRFRAEFLAAGESWALAGVPANQEVDAQHLAFEVNKAFSRGERVGWEMIKTAMALGLLPKPVFDGEGEPLVEALGELVDETYGGISFYTSFTPELAARIAALAR